MPPAWQISACEWEGPFGCHVIDAETATKIRRFLVNFESMTWADIRRSGNNHSMPVERLPSPSRRRLEERGLDDIDVLYSLRLTGKERLWGIRDRHIFRILWWDPDHLVYPVDKRNT